MEGRAAGSTATFKAKYLHLYIEGDLYLMLFLHLKYLL